MATVTVITCQVRKVLFRCWTEPAGTCQYCGRSFCARHGERLEDGQEVCSRKFCVAKRHDLVRHLAYNEIVSARNEARCCGLEGCERTLAGQCSRCRGLFCSRHVEAREEPVLENRVRVTRMATLCQHCWARRPIWLRQ